MWIHLIWNLLHQVTCGYLLSFENYDKLVEKLIFFGNSKKICLLSVWRRANTGNASLRNSLKLPMDIINWVAKAKPTLSNSRLKKVIDLQIIIHRVFKTVWTKQRHRMNILWNNSKFPKHTAENHAEEDMIIRFISLFFLYLYKRLFILVITRFCLFSLKSKQFVC